jgi:hypothetical protein
MRAVHEESNRIGEFLDWLNTQGIFLAEYECQRDPPLIRHRERYEPLLARFYNIDLNKVEDERQAILEAMRA